MTKIIILLASVVSMLIVHGQNSSGANSYYKIGDKTTSLPSYQLKTVTSYPNVNTEPPKSGLDILMRQEVEKQNTYNPNRTKFLGKPQMVPLTTEAEAFMRVKGTGIDVYNQDQYKEVIKIKTSFAIGILLFVIFTFVTGYLVIRKG